MNKQRLAGLIVLVLVAAVGVWWAGRKAPIEPAAANVQQLQQRIAALEKRLAELESQEPNGLQFAPQTVPGEIHILPQPETAVPEQQGDRREINGMSYYVLPLGTVAGVE